MSRLEIAQGVRALLGDYADQYDIDAIVDAITTYDPATGDVVQTVTDDDIMTIAEQHLLPEPEADTRGDDLHARVLAWASHRMISTRPLDIDGVQMLMNGEFQEGGLREWPTSPHFWVRLTAPDGEAWELGADIGSWEALADAIDNVRDTWETRRDQRLAAATSRLEKATQARKAAQAALAAAEAAEVDAIKTALDAGMTAYRAAIVTGYSQPTIARKARS